MTPAQTEQFDQNGCASRCIIKLAELHKKPISQDEFVLRFENRFPLWKTHCGLLGASGIIDVCRSLQLCREAEAFRSYKRVGQIYDETRSAGIFLLTERCWLDTTKDFFHCSLILDHANGVWHVWSPAENGEVVDAPSVTTQFLEDRLAHFLVLF